MRVTARAVLLLALSFCLPGWALAARNSECLLTLTADASNATSIGRSGRMMAATADPSGTCTFTVTACLDDSGAATCTAGTINSVRVMHVGRDQELRDLRQSLQSLLPATGRICTQTTMTIGLRETAVGPTHGRKIVRAGVVAADGRFDADSLMLLCQPSTFLRIQRGIFNVSCTSESCHNSATRAGNMVLEEGQSLANLVRVDPDNALARQELYKRVSPGVPGASFLLKKIEAPAPGEGERMPFGSPGLTQDRIDLIRNWILAGAPAEGVVAGDPGGFAPDKQPVIDPPPPPTDGFQVVLPAFTIPPRGEREICQYMELPNDQPIYVTGFEMSMNPGSHHFILYKYDGTQTDKFPQGPVDDPACLNFGPGDGGFGYRFITGAQVDYYDVPFPAGVAMMLKAHQPVIFNSHYINYWNAPETGQVWLNIHTTAAANVQYTAENIFDVNLFGINVPPGMIGSTSQTWRAPSDLYLFSLTSHMHKRGIQFVVDKVGGADNGTEIYRSGTEPNGWDDPLNKIYTPPLFLKKGEGLEYTCTHDNGADADHPVRLGCEGTSKDIFNTTYSCETDADCVDINVCKDGRCGNSTKGCSSDGDCGPAGTGRCIPQTLRFGFTGDDDMCIMPGLYYEATPNATMAPPAPGALRTNLRMMQRAVASRP